MRKIETMTANELSVCICKMVGPAERLLSDGAVREALDDMRDAIGKEASVEKAFSAFSTILYPVLGGEAHKDDTFEVLAALDGVSADEIANRNGLEVMRDVFIAFVVDKDVQTIFRPCMEARAK